MKRQAVRRPPARPHSIEALEQRIAPATFTVTNVSDIGAGSLREAINSANSTSGPDVIEFNILGATVGLRTITLRSALPTIFDAVLIDGYTQPGASPNTLGPGFGTNAALMIEVTGASITVPGIANGLTFGGSGSTVRGLVLNGFSGHGIATTGVSSMTFAGNFIGTNATGTALVPNAGSGIFIDGFSNTIGGTDPAARNLISGNANGGVRLEGQVTDGNTVAGNLIGTNAAGNAILGSGTVGVGVANIASGNVIGGLLPGARNVLAGATTAGVRLDGVSNTILHGNYIGTDVTGTIDLGSETGIIVTNAPGTRIGGNVAGAGNLVSGNTNGITIQGNSTGTVIQGNLIGTNAAGAAALPNGFWGIGVFSSNVTIGGAGAAGRNVISGNAEAGVLLSGFFPSGVRVEGNYVGVAADGVTPLGNGGHGVFLFAGTNNSVGGAAANAANIIAHNGLSGVAVGSVGGSDAPLGNTIQGNQIFSNGMLGIDLNNNGPTANDVADVDGGPNGLQNYPIITSASVSGAGTTISGTLQSTPGILFAVQLFANSAADPSGFGEGEIFLGTTSVTTDPNGNGTFTFSLPTPLPNSFISATATGNAGTSEFSQVRQAIALNTVFTWDGSAGTDWFTAANWTPDGVPGPGDTAILDINSTINLPRDTGVDVFRQSDGTFMSPTGTTFTVMESFEWSGGRQTGAGTTLLAIGSNSLFSGAASKNLDGRLLNNAGAVIWTGAGAIGMPGATINNLAGGVFDVQTDADILIPQGLGLPAGVFNNAGNFRKSASTGVTEVPPAASVAITFNNTGTVDVQSGVVSFNSGLTNSGTFNTASGASIEVRTAFSVLDAQFTGAGTTRLLSGITTANGTIGGGALVLEGATLDGTHTLAGGLRWVSGTIGLLFAGGTTTIPAGATLTLDNPNAVGLDGRSLVNAGTVVLQNSGGINMPGSTITNQPGATFDVQTDADLAVSQGLGLPAGIFNNAGTFRKSGGTGVTEVPPAASVAITFNNTGVVDAQTGTVAFNATATNSGIFATGAGANIEVRGTFAVSDGAQFNGGGTTRLLAGSTTANGIIGSASLVLDGATLEGTHTLAGGLVWISGNIGRQFAGGSTTIPGSATLTLDNPTTVGLEGHSLINAGTVRLMNSGALSMPGSTITNQPGALFDLRTDADIIIPAGGGLPVGAFNNLGSLRKSGGSGVTEFSVGGVALNVTNGGAVGAVEALSGTIHFGHAFTQSAGSTTLAGGNLATSSALTFAGGELRGIGLITGAVNNSGGIVRPGAAGSGIGILSINGDYAQGSAGILGIEIGGMAAGSQHDQLNVTGTASLAGELNVDLINGFSAPLGASFAVLPYASHTGSFTAFSGDTAGLTQNYRATGLTLDTQLPPSDLIVTTALDVVDPEDAVVSLREAILFANQNIGFDTINFNIPGTGVQTISPATPLPAVTERLAINGYSQPGAAANSLPNGNNAVLLIQLSGTPGVSGNGLSLNAGNSRVEGLIINGFDDGIVVNGPGGDVIAGNWIGVNATGSAAAANRDDGIEVNASNVVIGGTTAAARNVISGNTQRGIELTGGFGALAVEGNFIGTNAAGIAAVANGEGGVRAGTFNIDSPNVRIGGSLSGARNVISGNGEAGVHVQDSSAAVIFGNYIGVAVDGVTPIGNTTGVILNMMTGSSVGGAGATDGNVIGGNALGVFVLGGAQNSIQGNLIGVDATGAIAVGNNIGISLVSTAGTLIGGVGSGLRNVISGNSTNGILVGQGASDAFIDGNFIGINSAGTPLGNGGHGVAFADSNAHTVIRNTIANNGGAGVAVLTGRGISILANSIHNNLGLGIDLGGDGATPNDIGDIDVGANDLLNFPLITSVTPEAGGNSLITGTISAVPNTTLRIDVLSADASTFEGNAFLGFNFVTTDSAGTATFQLSLSDEAFAFASHLVAMATATDPGGAGSSEFGTPFQIGLPAGPTISVADVAIAEGQSGTKIATFTVTLSETAVQTVSVNFATEDLTASAGSDYQAAAGVLTFTPGDLTATISVTINGDTAGEPRERFLLDLSGAVNATLSDPQATGVIRDDDHHLLVTGDAKGTLVRVFDATSGELTAEFDAFDADFRGGVRVATGDVNGDGVNDIIAGAGVAGDARVRVFDGVTLEPLPGVLGDFTAFGRFYRGGVYVAAGDVNGDGFADVIVSPSGGGSGEVRVFDGTDGTELARLRAFGKGSGGVRVAAGDVNGDGRADIIAGSGLGSTVRIIDALTGGLLGGNDSEFRAFGKNFRGGVYVAAGDVNGDGLDDVIASAATDGKTFRIFESGNSRSNFDDADAYPGAFRGVRVGTVDANSDGIADIITAKARGDAKVTIFDGITHDRLFRLSGYPTNFLGGVFVG